MSAPTVERPSPDTTPSLGAVVEILEQPWDGKPIPDTSLVCPSMIRINGRTLYSTTADPVIANNIQPLILTGSPNAAATLTITGLAFWTAVDDPDDLPDPPDFPHGTVFELLQNRSAVPPDYLNHPNTPRFVGERIRPDYAVRLVGDGHEPLPVHVSSDDPVTIGFRPVCRPAEGRWPIRVTLTLLVRRLLIGDTTD